MQQKVTLTFEMAGQEPQMMEVDGYVMVAWNVDPDGKKLPVLNTSSPIHEAGEDLSHTVGAIALAMTRHPVDGVKVMGELVKAAMSKGMGMLEAASKGEIPDA